MEQAEPVPKKRSGFLKDWVYFLVLGLVMVGCFLAEDTRVQDIWSGWGYQAEGVVAEIEESLDLTKDGARIFKATRPTANNDVEYFNSVCPNFEKGEKYVVMGCYAEGQIHVFEVTHEQLTDGNKVTMAHELLHAAWARMDDKEKTQVKAWLNEAYDGNKAWFDDQLGSYEEEARQEEIYTRAGTTLANLPENLEEHYAKYFGNRGQIVTYYQNYRAPFDLLTQEMDDLNAKIKTVRAETEAEREAYRTGVADLNQRISQFNQCADTAGCFASEAQFNTRRAQLNRERDALEANRVSLNQKIDENNERIQKYRELKTSLGELNQAVDSRLEETQNKE